jgi:outer membrane protein OmpA-like peptidoglycan-associated protein
VDEPVDAESGPELSLVVDRHRARRPLAGRFWLAAVLLLLALTAITGATQRAAIEDTVRHSASGALVAHGLTGVRLVVDGRSVLAKVPTGRSPRAVTRVLDSVAGVASVQTTSVYATAAEARTCGSLQERLDRATQGQRVPFVGSSTQLTDSGRAMVRAVGSLLQVCRSAVVTVGGHTDSHTFHGADISLARAHVIVDLLKNQGVRPNRLLARGYADQFPLAKGDGAAAQALNQRGSFAVTGQ